MKEQLAKIRLEALAAFEQALTIDDKFYQQLQLRCYLLSSQLQVLDQYFPNMVFHFIDKTRIAVLA